MFAKTKKFHASSEVVEWDTVMILEWQDWYINYILEEDQKRHSETFYSHQDKKKKSFTIYIVRKVLTSKNIV